MFKIISAELKKLVARPGIYILSVVLALVLTLGVFIYKPTTSTKQGFMLKDGTFLEKYTDFLGGENNPGNAGKKAEADAKLDNAIKSVQNYRIDTSLDTYTQEEYISLLKAQIDEIFNTYQTCAKDGSAQEYINTTRYKLISSLEDLNFAIELAITNTQLGSYTLLTSKDNYNNYKTAYKEMLSWAKISIEKENLANHIADYGKNLKANLYNKLNTFKYPSMSDKTISTYTLVEEGSKLYTLNQRLNSIMVNIEYNHALATKDENDANTKLASKMDQLANAYVNTIDIYVNLIKYELITNAFTDLSINEQINSLHLSHLSAINSQSLHLRYRYLFENNKTENDFAQPLTIGSTSNSEINAYDYAYFILRLFSFVIVIYAIMTMCHSIAGEIKEGTLRYLSVRPVSRTQLLFGKWMSVLTMSAILTIFSFIISICVGGAIYGFETNTILTIFNGTAPVVLHPIAMLGIYVINMLIEIIIYSAFAMLISSLFKSDLLGTTLLLVLYLINSLLPMFVQGANSWLSYYLFSHISIYALFGSSVFAGSNNFFNMLFGAKVYAGTHVALTISAIVIMTLVLTALSIKIFKKKEL